MRRKARRGQPGYEFEAGAVELDGQIEELREETDQEEQEKEHFAARIEALEEQRDRLLAEIVENLTPYQHVKLARHPLRPQSADYIPQVFDDFIELHGDRRFGDDKAIITGLARLEGHRVVLIAQQKGRDTHEKLERNFGMPNPEGYRKALAKMALAEKFALPVVSFIDTPGAAPAVEAEERGQGMAIAENICRMSGLRTPIVILVTGEGCSGGALGIGVGDRFAMLENAYYSVISPEGCAAILWRDSEKADQAAASLKLTAGDMLELGVVDEIIEEPLGGAHRDPKQTAANIRAYLKAKLEELRAIPIEQLLEERYQRYRTLGTHART